MKKIANQVNAYALIITVLLFGAAYWVMKEKTINSSLQDNFDAEKLKSESLLSEKLLVEKNIDRLKAQLLATMTKSDKLEAELQSTLRKLQQSESEIKKAKGEANTLKAYKKQHEELLALQKELQNKIEALAQGKSTADMENQRLAAQIAFLEERNKLLSDDLRRASLALMDNTEIQAVKNKNRLTVRASKTRKLKAEFEIPGNIKNVSYKITDPSGKVLTNTEGTIASTVTANSNNYVASSDGTSQQLGTSKVEMVYIPKEKLKAGTYKVEILSDNLHLGGLQVKLR